MNGDKSSYRQVVIDGSNIVDESTFHDVFKKELGFPAFYGRNFNAWIDCMSYCDDAESEMTSVVIDYGQVLVLQIENAAAMKSSCPSVFAAMLDCVAFVNHRRTEGGEPPLIALSYYA